MSRYRSELYFAPDLPFSEVDLNGGRLPEHFQRRIEGFYLTPARILADDYRHAFASGVLVVCAMDAIGQLSGISGNTRIQNICSSIPDLAPRNISFLFVKNFRHGLVHGARIKGGCEFSLDLPRVAQLEKGRLSVNPSHLSEALSSLLGDIIGNLSKDLQSVKSFRKRLKKKFRAEFLIAGHQF